MKITDVRTIIVQNDADWSRGGDEPAYRGGKYLLFLELVTDEGITGLGERITGNTFSGAGREFPIEDMKSQIALIHEIGRQYLIAAPPFTVE